MSLFRILPVALLLASPAAAAPLAQANVLQDGSFETNFASWTQSQNTADTGVMTTPYDGYTAQDGTHYALLGPVGGDGVLSQSFTDTPGARLTISFWLANDGDMPNDFTASLDSTSLLHLADASAFGWTEYSATVTGTGHDTLSFAFRNDPGYWALDNVQVSEIPEPATAIFLPIGMIALGGLVARRKRARN